MRHNTLGDLFGILIILAIAIDILSPVIELIIPLALIGVTGFVAYKAIQSSSNKESTRSKRTTTSRSYSYTERKTSTSKATSSDLAKINIYLRKYFRSHSDIEVPNNLVLKLRTERYTSLTSLDVYHTNGTRLGTLTEYRNQYGDEYDKVFDALLAMANGSTVSSQQTIVDAEIVEDTPKKKETVTKQKTEEKTQSQYFIDKINDLNDDIPHEEISNGLYQTCALLKQIQMLENKFPDSKDKMNKMYGHYLPYLVQILETYENLQTVKSDPSYEKSAEQLTRTIDSINEALSNIIPTMSDSDFTNLSVDMATLEALLQKDGLTGGMDSVEASKEKKL